MRRVRLATMRACLIVLVGFLVPVAVGWGQEPPAQSQPSPTMTSPPPETFNRLSRRRQVRRPRPLPRLIREIPPGC